MPTVREATFKLLRDLGVTTIFGNPGSTELPMFRQFPDDFRYILGLQESVVVGMADGFAQATRLPAFVNLHSSAGTGHALGNIFTAYRNQTPLVVTAGQQARSILPFEPFLFADRATEFPRPFVKWACEPARGADVPLAIARAFYEARTSPCGPTFVSVPVDDWDVECDWVAVRDIRTTNPGDPAAIQSLAGSLAAARSPAFVLGAGCSRDGAWNEFVDLAEKTGARVFSAVYANRNVFPEDHPLFCGFLPPFREQLVTELQNYDLIIAFGGPLNVYHVEGAGPHLPADAECWVVGDNPQVLAWAPQGTAVLGNCRSIAQQLSDRVAPHRPRMPAARPAPAETDGTTFNDKLVMERLASWLPAGAVIVEEAPTSKGALQDQVRFNQPDSYFTNASGGLGHSLPAAVGISLARPDVHVVAVIGDGSAMYGIQALHAARQLNSRLTVLVINNARYEALRMFGRVFGMDQVVGTDLQDLDFVALAKGHGVMDAWEVKSVSELDQAFEVSFANDGPSLINAMVIS